jgi:hypothetical protein
MCDAIRWGTGATGLLAGAGYLGWTGTTLAFVGIAAGAPLLAGVAIGAAAVVVVTTVAQ